MDITKFLATPEYDITIVTHRDIFQHFANAIGKFNKEYQDLSAIIALDTKTMKKLGVKEDDRVKIHNKYGKVVVKVKKLLKEDSGEGMGFMPNSAWSNILVSPETDGTGIPDFKKIKAKISKTKEEVTNLEDLLK
ncbi:MAG: molybdopterin dinucleotide binding domain-containing protein [Methanosarcinales archaeon]